MTEPVVDPWGAPPAGAIPVTRSPAGELVGNDGKVYSPQGADAQGVTHPVIDHSQANAAPVANPWGDSSAAPPPMPPGRPDEALGFAQGFTKPITNAATMIENGINAIPMVGKPIMGALNSAGAAMGMAPSQAVGNAARAAYIDNQAQHGVVPGKTGEFLGEMAGTIPVAAVTRNPFVGGALTGAALTDDPNSLRTTAIDAGIGAIGGKAGDMAVRGLGAAVAPRIGAAARTLMNGGVTLTPGQILGGGAKRLEDAASSIPLVGDFIKGRQASSLMDFNRATVQQSLDHIGEKLPDNIATGHDALNYAGDKMSEAYGKALDGVKVTPDAELALDLHGIRRNLGTLSPTDHAHVNSIIDTLVSPRVNYTPQGGHPVMDGETFKSLDSALGGVARQYPGAVADKVRAVQGALRGAVARQNPDQAPLLDAANAGYAHLIRAETAAAAQSAGKDGIFSAPGFMGAVKRGDSSIRDRQFARGNALMQDWAGAGSSVLPSSVPDSGSAGRGMVGALILGGGHAVHTLLNPATGLPVAGLTAAYTRPGQAAIRAAIIHRPAWAPVARGLVDRFAPAGVAAGSLLPQSAAQGLLPSPTP